MRDHPMAQADSGRPDSRRPDKPGQAAAHQNGGGRSHGASFGALMLGSIGVVYGDIGTSPLYAFKESLAHVMLDGTDATRAEVIGLISLFFWALMIVVTLKYVICVMQMDSKGE
ncbi:MAG: KUP/HAK/KT family potassium transporter, partial [Hyphomonadaceae bacterium]